MNYRVGIDIGGTFTDFALLKDDEVILHKNLSTPEDRSLGVMQGLAPSPPRKAFPCRNSSRAARRSSMGRRWPTTP
ncbi:hydantoinase/oxoprolinase N-terminal domain-containing protein [Novosphingobium panipatense]